MTVAECTLLVGLVTGVLSCILGKRELDKLNR